MRAVGVPDAIKAVRDVLAELDDPRRVQEESFAPDGILRLRAVIDKLNAAVTPGPGPPPVVTPGPALPPASSARMPSRNGGSTVTSVRAGQSAGAAARLDSLNSLIDQVVGIVRAWETPDVAGEQLAAALIQVRSDLQAETRPVTLGGDELGAQLAAIAQERADLQRQGLASLDDIRADEISSANLHTRSAVLVRQLEAKVAEQDVRIADLRATIEQQGPRLDQAIAKFEHQIPITQQTRATQAHAMRESLRQDFDAATALLELDARNTRVILGERLAEAHQLVDVISVTGTASAYGRDARRLKKTTDTWRLVAIALGVLATVTAVLTGQAIGHTATQISVRASVGFALVAGAAYATYLTAQHRHRAELARRLELILTACTAFMHGLSPLEKQRARERVTEAVFGEEDEYDAYGVARPSADNLTLTRLIDLIQRGRNA